MKSYSYECYSCNQLVDQSFFLCCNCHVSCNYCQRLDRVSRGDTCPVCGTNNVHCLSYIAFQKKRKNHCELVPGEPTLILPSPRVCSLNDLDNAFSRNNVIQCPDCHKYMFLTHVKEHYANDHKSTTMIPIFPGAIVSFRFSPQAVEEGAIKRLQMFLMIDVTDSTDSSSDQDINIGGEKIFFLAGTKIKNRGDGRNTNLFALWLCASFYVTSTAFSLEITSHFNSTISTTVTGVPIDLTKSDLFKLKEQPVDIRDSAVILKESSIETLENHGGCIMNASIRNSWE